MKRKTKRQGLKRIVAYVTSIGVIFAIINFSYNFLKDWIQPKAIQLIIGLFSLDKASGFPLPFLYSLFIIIIVILDVLLSKLILNLNKPSTRYFDSVDFKQPTDEVIKDAATRILNSEKTLPHFVHVAPINLEIDQFYRELYEKDFVWENGKPGDGKTMLAYHALYRYRARIGFSYKNSIKLFWCKYRVYRLNLELVKSEKQIEEIINVLDNLKGGRRKIILIDDAHKISFEDSLRYELEQEAKEKLNGKIVWINTNYLEEKRPDQNDSIKIEFENFYPKLITGLYNSQNQIIKGIVNEKCNGLNNAIKLKEQGKINDPWHFNFVATNGEQRITELLEKLSTEKEVQDVLLLSLFLFSARNIITGEKEINQTEFSNLLSSIEIQSFKKTIENYKPNRIIAELGSQEKGRFIIIENRNSLDRGFLRAPHFRLSIAVIKSITSHLSITDENLIKQMIAISQILFTDDLKESKYFGIYFNSLQKYQGTFLSQNNAWIKKYITEIVLEQLYVYPPLLRVLRKYHHSFFQELLTDEYFSEIASRISLSNPSLFSAIQQIIQIFGSSGHKLIHKLEWEKLAKAANRIVITQLEQLAGLINALGAVKEKQEFIENIDWLRIAKVVNNFEVIHLMQVTSLIKALDTSNERQKLIEKIDWEKIAVAANQIGIAQFEQIASIINVLGTCKEKLDLIAKIDWKTLAANANKVDVSKISQVADLIYALGTSNEKQELIEMLEMVKFAKAINDTDAANFKQVADFLNALGPGRKKQELIENIDWIKLAEAANNSEKANLNQVAYLLDALGASNKKQELIEKINWQRFVKAANCSGVSQIKQVADLINALGTDKMKLLGQLEWETLAKTVNKNEALHLQQVAVFINALGPYKENLINNLDWEKLAKSANDSDFTQIYQVADLINSLGTDKEKLINRLNEEVVINNSKNIKHNQINALCIIINSFNTDKQEFIINNIDWVSLLNKLTINHWNVKSLSSILFFQNKKQESNYKDEAKIEIQKFLFANQREIVYHSTHFFVSPEDFFSTSKLLESLSPYDTGITFSIIGILKYKLIDYLKINPNYFLHFSGLLNIIHKISPQSSKQIIRNPLVREKIYQSLRHDEYDEDDGVQSLLKSVRDIDPEFHNKLNSIERIENLNL